MSKKSDHSIERIFRQALTQYDTTTFQDSDWVKMEKLLNEEANRRAAARSKRIKGTAYTLTGLTGLIIAVYFLAFRNPSDSITKLNDSVNETQATGDLNGEGNVKLKNPPAGLLSETSPSNTPDEAATRESTAPSNKTPEANKIPGEENTASRTDKSSTEDRQAQGEAIGKKAFEDQQKDLHGQRSGTSDINSKRIDEPSTRTSDPGLKAGVIATAPATATIGSESALGANPLGAPGKVEDTNTSTSISGQPIGIAAATTPADANLATSKQNSEPSSVSPLVTQTEGAGRDSLSNENQNTLTDRIDSLENRNDESAKKEKVKPPYRLNVAFILAPEFSTTSLNEYSTPGGSFGLRIGYQVSNRLNIITGIIRSTKKYEGDGYDYTPRNPLYWKNRTNGVVPKAIDSECLVYELPLGVQFDAIQTEKSRVFLSAALASYFMISQEYDYTFESPNPGADTGWRSSGSESYWFNVGMVSAGYERYVYRSFAIGIEPYMKFSFGEIGWPNIKLFSAGAYVTMRYRFVKPQK